jgi:hypothetical protein
MQTMKKVFMTVFCMVVVFSGIAAGLATEDYGNKPVNTLNYAEWANTGILPVLNDSNRVYSTWCNGNEFFYFSGDITSLNAFLKKCAEIKNAHVTLEFKKGKGVAKTFSSKKKIPYAWRVNIRTGIAAARAVITENKTVGLTVYVDNKTIQRKDIKLPETVVLEEKTEQEENNTSCTGVSLK